MKHILTDAIKNKLNKIVKPIIVKENIKSEQLLCTINKNNLHWIRFTSPPGLLITVTNSLQVKSCN